MPEGSADKGEEIEMTLNDIVNRTAGILNIENEISSDQGEKDLLVKCAKDAVGRVSGEFTDIKAKQTLRANSGKILYTDFQRSVKRVLRVSKDGERKAFNEEFDGIRVDFNGYADVTYAYLSEPDALNSVIDLPPRFGLALLALGTAGEYCYRKGFYKEAQVYDNRFSMAMNNVLSGGKSVTVKAVNA